MVARSVCFESEDRLLAHIAVQHVNWIPFECLLCPVMCSTDSVLQLHYQQAHKGVVPKAIYTHESDKKREMLDILVQSKACSTQSNESISDMRPASVSTPDQNNGLSVRTEQAKEVIDPFGNEGNSPIEEDVSNTSTTEDSSIGAIRTTSQHKSTSPESQATSEQDTVQDQTQNDVTDRLSLVNAETSVRTLQTTMEDVRSPLTSVRKHKRKATSTKETTNRKIGRRSIRFLTDSPNAETADDASTTSKDMNMARPLKAKLQLCMVCNKMITLGNRQYHLWNRHMSEPRFNCKLCDFKTSYHYLNSKRKHHIHASWEDQKPKLMEEYKEAWLASFGDCCHFWRVTPLDATMLDQKKDVGVDEYQDNHIPPPAPPSNLIPPTSSGRSDQLRCNLCNLLQTPDRKGPHVWRYHVSAQRYRCGGCTYGTHNVSGIRSHCAKAQHGGRPCWSDHTPQLLDEYRKAFNVAFGSEGSRRWPRGDAPVSRPRNKATTATNGVSSVSTVLE